MDSEELMEAEVARLRELHEAGALSEAELQEGIAEARMAAGLSPVEEAAAEGPKGRDARLPLIIAFVAVDLVIVAAVLIFLFAD